MKLYGTVTGVTLIEHISEGVDFCQLKIDFDEPYIFYEWNKLQEFQGKLVEYETRLDYYKDRQYVVISNIVQEFKVHTLDKVEGIRLIPDNDKVRVGCNVDISTVKFGDTIHNCVAFLSDYKAGASEKAQWIDCKMIDMYSKAFTLRIFTRGNCDGFTPDEVVEAKVGRYVKFDLTSTSYGFQTGCIELENIEVTPPPEVDVAVEVIKDAVKDDAQLQEYMQQYNYIDYFKTKINGEIGYDLVFIAAEIQEIQALCNISNYYDTKLMIRAAITSRGYLLPTNTHFSRPVLNINKLLRTSLSKDKDLMLILDPLTDEEPTPTKKMYMQLASFVANIINDRRSFVVEDKSIDKEKLHELSGGLLC